LQGDVIGLTDAYGNMVAEYKYDAWGKTIYINSYNLNIANVNPFRYRSYYYDYETGWYYLQSRYYDPTIGRFISADGMVGAVGDILSANMYAYCANNPIMFTDETGYSWRSFWDDVGDWFDETFGFSLYKEENAYESYYGVVETKTGFGYCNPSDKPVTFYTSIPSKWWKLDQYSIGVKFTNSEGKGFIVFNGTRHGFGWYGDGTETTISSNILGRVGARQTIYEDNGFYSFTQTNWNKPETVVVVVGIYYLALWLGSIELPSTNPNPTPVL